MWHNFQECIWALQTDGSDSADSVSRSRAFAVIAFLVLIVVILRVPSKAFMTNTSGRAGKVHLAHQQQWLSCSGLRQQVTWSRAFTTLALASVGLQASQLVPPSHTTSFAKPCWSCHKKKGVRDCLRFHVKRSISVFYTYLANSFCKGLSWFLGYCYEWMTKSD